MSHIGGGGGGGGRGEEESAAAAAQETPDDVAFSVGERWFTRSVALGARDTHLS